MKESRKAISRTVKQSIAKVTTILETKIKYNTYSDQRKSTVETNIDGYIYKRIIPFCLRNYNELNAVNQLIVEQINSDMLQNNIPVKAKTVYCGRRNEMIGFQLVRSN